MKNLKEKGITLVALVVTIIILLILTGITIGTITGENGLFKRAKDTAKKYEDASMQEENDLIHLGELLNSHKYKPIVETYTITYNLNGGIGTPPESQIKYYGEPLKLSTVIPIRAKYTFVGWATSEEKADAGTVDYKPGAMYEKEENMNLYATWSMDIKVGDTVDYTPKTDNNSYILLSSQSGKGTYSSSLPYTLKTLAANQTISQETYTWKVLNIDEIGNVEIVGVPTSENKQTVTFQGALGYNNGVYLLDDICNKLYSNNELGTIARSIDLEDIQEGMSPIGETENKASGEVKPFTGNYAYYPDLYNFQKGSGVNAKSDEELKKDGISESDTGETKGIPINMGETLTSQGYSKATNLRVKDTHIHKEQQEKYYNNAEFYKILFPSGISYWLASRCSSFDSNFAVFDLCFVRQGYLVASGFFNSQGGKGEANLCVCPVVFLGTNIQLTKDDSGKWTPSKISK